MLALLVRQVVQPLQEHHAHQHFGGIRRATALDSVRAWAGRIHGGRHGREVEQLVNRRQRLHIALKLGLPLLAHEQVIGGFGREKARRLDARRDHGRHLAGSTDGAAEWFRVVPQRI
jgi:hypothetical protein